MSWKINWFWGTPPATKYSEPFEDPWREMILSDKQRQRVFKELKEFQISTSTVRHLRILLHGPTHSGKSSFINSVNTVLQGRNTTVALANSAGGFSFTRKFQTYKLKKDRSGSFFPFVFNDIMGLDENDSRGVQTDDIISVLGGHVPEGYTFNPMSALTKQHMEYNSAPSLDDKVHCLVSVLPGDVISLMPQGILEKMKKVRQKAIDLGIPQVIIITKVDSACKLVSKDLKMIYKSRKIKEKMQECSNLLDVPMHCIFPVKNYCEEITTNTNVDIVILTAMNNIVHFANDFVERQ
ncbi:interferon-induced protein 44-like isoform X1 [Hoplias malabaricus]|uniref:interferon-induced protein 44-like isoform X1 n=1 Tax=Hoplias malabaricus TaxID=27720 RepID=UPI0034637F21